VIEWSEGDEDGLKAEGDVDCICVIAIEARPTAVAVASRRLRELGGWIGPSVLRLIGMMLTRSAAAASIALIMGIALGWLVRGAPKPGMASELMEVQGNRLVAGSALQAALQSLPSGGETVTSSGGQVYRLSMRLTFQDQSGDYCRQYQIVTARPARHSGIACGKGGEMDGQNPVSSAARFLLAGPHRPGRWRRERGNGRGDRGVDIWQSAGDRRRSGVDRPGLDGLAARRAYRESAPAAGASLETDALPLVQSPGACKSPRP
jgi:hypothetical protein